MGSRSEREGRRRLRSLLVAFFILLVPFADFPLSEEAQLAGIFDNSSDFDDDFDEIQLVHVAPVVAADASDASDQLLPHRLRFASVAPGPAASAWPGLSPDERAPPRV